MVGLYCRVPLMPAEELPRSAATSYEWERRRQKSFWEERSLMICGFNDGGASRAVADGGTAAGRVGRGRCGSAASSLARGVEAGGVPGDVMDAGYEGDDGGGRDDVSDGEIGDAVSLASEPVEPCAWRRSP